MRRIRSAGPLLLLVACAFLAHPALANKKQLPARPINLNSATSEQLQQVPGIGPVTAEKILKMRKLHGPFRSVNELRAIKGIGPKRLAKMKPYLAVDSDSAEGKPAKNAARPTSTAPH